MSAYAINGQQSRMKAAKKAAFVLSAIALFLIAIGYLFYRLREGTPIHFADWAVMACVALIGINYIQQAIEMQTRRDEVILRLNRDAGGLAKRIHDHRYLIERLAVEKPEWLTDPAMMHLLMEQDRYLSGLARCLKESGHLEEPVANLEIEADRVINLSRSHIQRYRDFQ